MGEGFKSTDVGRLLRVDDDSGEKADDLPRLRALRGALRKTQVVGEVLKVPGAKVSVKLVMPAGTWPLLAWAVSDSPEEMDMDPLKLTETRHQWPAK